MDAKSGLCIGCARTLDEIARWAEMSNAERERVIAELPQRNSRTQHELRPAAKRR